MSAPWFNLFVIVCTSIRNCFLSTVQIQKSACLRSSNFFDCLTFEDGTDMLFETSVTSYKSRLRNIFKDRGPHLHRSGSLKSCKRTVCVCRGSCVLSLSVPQKVALVLTLVCHHLLINTCSVHCVNKITYQLLLRRFSVFTDTIIRGSV